MTGEQGTGVWERVYSGNLPANSKWRTKEKKREQFGKILSSETQGKLLGAGKIKMDDKKFGRIKKSQERREEHPGDKVLTDQFQTVGVVLGSDWCQKTFVFFFPITNQQE